MKTHKHFHIGIYAPAGNVRDESALIRAQGYLRQLGHHVTLDHGVLRHEQRFAGNDEERLAALYRMLRDDTVELAIPARGGYGWTRLLDKIDYSAFIHDTTLWLGHSDFTAFQLALLACAQRISFAGPMACYDFGDETPSDFTAQHCFDLLNANQYEIECMLDNPLGKDFSAQGTLWGGNLTMIAHLIGTSYMPDIENGILFLEDVGEAPYRIERMLYQLLYSGILPRQKAVLLGNFSEMPTCAHDYGYDFSSVITHIQKIGDIPFFGKLPFGHARDKLTLPIGASCTLHIAKQGQSKIKIYHYQP
ncbi:MAG: LD-carboxypeptidase [Burkholderiales bacterium]|jgi:muramoyltetrapeptide carboxypeptidase|nr:LD-carboxypeptidase [Burkholderiales bacterium]